MFIAHEFAGLALGLYLQRLQPTSNPTSKLGMFCKNWGMPLACLAGSAVPDIPFLIEMLHNYAHGFPLGAKSVWWLESATELFHNLFLWLVACSALIAADIKLSRPRTLAVPIFLSCGLGALECHIPLDVISHGWGENFTGNNYFAPLPEWTATHLGLFLYGQRGSLALSWQEGLFCIAFLILDAALIAQKFRMRLPLDKRAMAVAEH